jgi:hypothetical protein
MNTNMKQHRNQRHANLLIKHSDSEGVITIFRDIPEDYILYLNYPNPFSRMTVIQYAIPPVKINTIAACSEYRQPPVHEGENSIIQLNRNKQYVAIKIFNVSGEEVRSLVNEEQSPGIFQAKLSAEGMPEGIYYYQLIAGEYISSRKIMLVKK